MTALAFDGPGIRSVTEGDSEDLRSPLIGGGAFWRAWPLSVAAAKFNVKPRVLERLAKAGEVTSATYEPPGGSSAVLYIVLNTKTVMRLSGAEKETEE
jgi:hypothetical protein